MAYLVGNLPPDAPLWLVAELRKIQESSLAAVDGFVLKTLYAEPKKKPEGLVVKADGTTWKPNGTGTAGVYCYRGGTWTFLG